MIQSGTTTPVYYFEEESRGRPRAGLRGVPARLSNFGRREDARETPETTTVEFRHTADTPAVSLRARSSQSLRAAIWRSSTTFRSDSPLRVQDEVWIMQESSHLTPTGIQPIGFWTPRVVAARRVGQDDDIKSEAARRRRLPQSESNMASGVAPVKTRRRRRRLSAPTAPRATTTSTFGRCGRPRSCTNRDPIRAPCLPLGSGWRSEAVLATGCVGRSAGKRADVIVVGTNRAADCSLIHSNPRLRHARRRREDDDRQRPCVDARSEGRHAGRARGAGGRAPAGGAGATGCDAAVSSARAGLRDPVKLKYWRS